MENSAAPLRDRFPYSTVRALTSSITSFVYDYYSKSKTTLSSFSGLTSLTLPTNQVFETATTWMGSCFVEIKSKLPTEFCLANSPPYAIIAFFVGAYSTRLFARFLTKSTSEQAEELTWSHMTDQAILMQDEVSACMLITNALADHARRYGRNMHACSPWSGATLSIRGVTWRAYADYAMNHVKMVHARNKQQMVEDNDRITQLQASEQLASENQAIAKQLRRQARKEIEEKLEQYESFDALAAMLIASPKTITAAVTNDSVPTQTTCALAAGLTDVTQAANQTLEPLPTPALQSHEQQQQSYPPQVSFSLLDDSRPFSPAAASLNSAAVATGATPAETADVRVRASLALAGIPDDEGDDTLHTALDQHDWRDESIPANIDGSVDITTTSLTITPGHRNSADPYEFKRNRVNHDMSCEGGSVLGDELNEDEVSFLAPFSPGPISPNTLRLVEPNNAVCQSQAEASNELLSSSAAYGALVPALGLEHRSASPTVPNDISRISVSEQDDNVAVESLTPKHAKRASIAASFAFVSPEVLPSEYENPLVITTTVDAVAKRLFEANQNASKSFFNETIQPSTTDSECAAPVNSDVSAAETAVITAVGQLGFDINDDDILAAASIIEAESARLAAQRDIRKRNQR